MSMLTGPEIVRQVRLGAVTIDPFDPEKVGSNSYDLTLSPDLLVYEKNYPLHLYYATTLARSKHLDYSRGVTTAWETPVPLDMAVEEPTVPLTIPPEGLTLWPGVLYLAATNERAGSDRFVPCIDGRSSVGRMALTTHVTAGFGDVGFGGRDAPSTWTLELTVTLPLVVYAGVRVCQVSFTVPVGELKPYAGKYASQTGPRASGLWKDFQNAKGAT